MRIGATGPIFGIADRKPLKGWPAGLVRIKIRNSGYARGYVRPPGGGIREFLIEEAGGYWCPCHEQGANINAAPIHPRGPHDR
jgi:hypothetical protein